MMKHPGKTKTGKRGTNSKNTHTGNHDKEIMATLNGTMPVRHIHRTHATIDKNTPNRHTDKGGVNDRQLPMHGTDSTDNDQRVHNTEVTPRAMPDPGHRVLTDIPRGLHQPTDTREADRPLREHHHSKTIQQAWDRHEAIETDNFQGRTLNS